MNLETPANALLFDRNHIWHPYASASSPPPCSLVESAKGVYLQLAGGKQIIDGMSSWWAAIHGYNHPVLNEAIRRQTEKMSHVMFGGLTHEPAIELARRLIDLTPPELNYVFFADSGSVAVEVAMKMALQYFHAKGQTCKRRFATVRSGYHGDTWHAMSVCDPVTGMHSIFGDSLPQQLFANKPQTPFNGVWDESEMSNITELIEQYHSEIAAFIIEPIVQGAGGMRFYHPQFLQCLRKLCTHYNILLIADEIATGFGRSGKMFACQHASITPDLLCVGKALTGGYMTLAATLAASKVAETISSAAPHVFMHGPTFMGNPLACAVACASIDLLTDNNCVPARIAEIEQQLREGLLPVRHLDAVENVRVLGAIGVIEMKKTVDIAALQPAFIENGIWLRPFGKLIYTMPPYIIDNNELATLINGMVNVVENCAFQQKKS
ncbi:MAG: adenosylmethionine--8-amino-7-oxononanoate transaminase [Prevotellaceae bacterium]|nr:adenosylmethionine--8-amino-7-oxononanoate transaminase [Prevotellaceae bacterium]